MEKILVAFVCGLLGCFAGVVIPIAISLIGIEMEPEPMQRGGWMAISFLAFPGALIGGGLGVGEGIALAEDDDLVDMPPEENNGHLPKPKPSTPRQPWIEPWPTEDSERTAADKREKSGGDG